MNQQSRVGAKVGDDAQFLRKRINQRRYARRSNHGVGVPIKRNDHGGSLVLAGIANRLPDDLLMAEVHAIKHANGSANFLRAGFQFTGGVDDVHLNRLNELKQLNQRSAEPHSTQRGETATKHSLSSIAWRKGSGREPPRHF